MTREEGGLAPLFHARGRAFLAFLRVLPNRLYLHSSYNKLLKCGHQFYLLKFYTHFYILKVALVYWRVPWKNTKGERMRGELPQLPYGHFHRVNFFGRPLSKIHGPIYYIWHCLTPVVWVSCGRSIPKFANFVTWGSPGRILVVSQYKLPEAPIKLCNILPSQLSDMITPLFLVGDKWSTLHFPWKLCDPRKNLSTPSPKGMNNDWSSNNLLLTCEDVTQYQSLVAWQVA